MRGSGQVQVKSVPDGGIKPIRPMTRRLLLLTRSGSAFRYSARNAYLYQLVAEPDKQEQRNTDIGRRDAAPVDGIFQERFIVLPQRNNQHSTKAKIGPSGKNPERYGKSFTSYPLYHVTATEAIMANGNPQPR